MEINAIVAGAGIWGSTVARVLAEAGRKVLVLERRSAPGGNVRCETDPETGIGPGPFPDAHGIEVLHFPPLLIQDIPDERSGKGSL